MMLQLRFAPRFSAAIRAGEKTQTFRLGAPRAQPGMPIQLIESGSGKLLHATQVLRVEEVTMRRSWVNGQPLIEEIRVGTHDLTAGEMSDFASLEGFSANEPGCTNSTEAMARFFATIYPWTVLIPDSAGLYGHITAWSAQTAAVQLGEAVA